MDIGLNKLIGATRRISVYFVVICVMRISTMILCEECYKDREWDDICVECGNCYWCDHADDCGEGDYEGGYN